MKNKRLNLNEIVTLVFISCIFILFLYSLGFFTNLLQIRGVDRKLHDMYQDYVRMVFNLSLWGIVFVFIRKVIVSQSTKPDSIYQFIVELIMAVGVMAIAVYSLSKMGNYIKLYQGVNIDDVRLLYSDYSYDDSVFKAGYIIYSINLLVSVIFMTIRTVMTFKKKKGEKVER